MFLYTRLSRTYVLYVLVRACGRAKAPVRVSCECHVVSRTWYAQLVFVSGVQFITYVCMYPDAIRMWPRDWRLVQSTAPPGGILVGRRLATRELGDSWPVVVCVCVCVL